MNRIDKFRVAQLEIIQDEAKELFTKKNQDYGDAFADYGTVGVLVRMGDKIRRFQSITNKGINLVEDEKLRDTLIDLHNYAAMGIMLIDEKKFNSQYSDYDDKNTGSLSEDTIEERGVPLEDSRGQRSVPLEDSRGQRSVPLEERGVPLEDSRGQRGVPLEDIRGQRGVPLEEKTWKVEGSMGHWYDRKSFINDKGNRQETCSCPSFKYCSYKYKTCKHI